MGNSCPDIGELETMRATCPTCETAYTVPDERIGAKGRKVRCTKCGDEWRVTMAAAEAVIASAPKPVEEAPASQADVDDLFAAPKKSEAAREPAAVDDIDSMVGWDTAEADAQADRRLEAEGANDTHAGDEPDGQASDHVPAAETAPTSVPARRVKIRMKRRFPRIGRGALTAVASRIQPFVGPLVLAAACLVLGSTYVFRQSIVAAAPDLAGLYAALGAPINLRGLTFGRIETLREIDNGQPVLVVEGSISNVTKQMRDVPALRFALRGADTQELYAWSIDPKSTTIESGDTIRFRTRLAAPPDQATEVQVRFVERRNQQAGLQ